MPALIHQYVSDLSDITLTMKQNRVSLVLNEFEG